MDAHAGRRIAGRITILVAAGVLALSGGAAQALQCGVTGSRGSAERLLTGRIQPLNAWRAYALGQVVDVEPIDGDYGSNGARAVVELAAVYKGSLPDRLTLRDLPTGISGVGLREGRRYFFTLLRDRDGWFVQACSLTYRVGDGEYRRLLAMTDLPPTDTEAPAGSGPLGLLAAGSAAALATWLFRRRIRAIG